MQEIDPTQGYQTSRLVRQLDDEASVRTIGPGSPTEHDRLRREVARARVVILATGICVACVVIWALTRSDTIVLPNPARLPHSSKSDQPDPLVTALDQEPFDTLIWNPLPPEVLVEPSPTVMPPAPPLRVSLLGIEHASDGTFRAVIYDQQKDEILLLGSGDAIQDRQVRLIGKDAVELIATKGDVQRLAMEETSGTSANVRRGGAR